MDRSLASEFFAPVAMCSLNSAICPATYTLIHAFLTKHSHAKAAEAVKKAAKAVVVLKDDIKVEGPQLDEIIEQWKQISQKKSKQSCVFLDKFRWTFHLICGV